MVFKDKRATVKYFHSYFFNFAIFLSTTSYCSERLLEPHEMPNLTEFSLHKHPQHNLYDDLSATINRSLNQGKKAYAEKDYQQASLFIKGAITYSGVMYRELDKVLDETSRDRAHYIVADCHLNHLNSPQHALESLRSIHNKQTAYGILTSEYIAQSLYKKAIDIAGNNKKLSEKLKAEAHLYSDGRVQALY